jgi:3-hydroxyacyl-[acyl-carrier-protein] dehydratase
MHEAPDAPGTLHQAPGTQRTMHQAPDAPGTRHQAPGTPLDLTRLDRAGIEAILPHRHPFLFVDRIVAHEPGKSIAGVRRIPHADRYVTVGPDGVPAWSAAVLLESLLQVGGLLVMSAPEDRGQLAVITGIERLRCHGGVRAGEEVRLEAAIKRRIGPVGRMTGRVLVGGRAIAHGTMRFALIPRERAHAAE